MVWGWLVCWGSLVGWLVFWVVWFTGVGNIRNISTIRISGVGDSLDTAIGKVDGVGSRQGLSIGGFRSVEFGSRVVIGYSIFESEWFWGFIISSWGMMRGSGWVVWSSSGSKSHEGRHNSKS